MTQTYGDMTVTTEPIVQFCVRDPNGGFGTVAVTLKPGETKTVMLNGKAVKIQRVKLE